MFCTSCGKSISDDSKFCLHCGEAVVKPKSETVTPERSRTSTENQLQCPKCGGFKVYRFTSESSTGLKLLHVVLTVITLGIWLPIIYIYYSFIHPFRPNSPDDTLTCGICGYEWKRGLK